MALQAKKQLGFGEAVKLASSRLGEFGGRSRRSEFWWWMLLVIIAEEIVTSFATNLYLSAALATIIMALGLSVTVRRVQDTGRSALWVYISYGLGIINQFLAASSTFVQKLTDMALSGSVDPDKISKLAEKNMGELSLIAVSNMAFAIVAIAVIVFCLMDGKPETNKYGESPKYYEA